MDCVCTRFQGFTSLLSMFEDGTFVCWLVSNLGGSPIRGAHRRPLTEAARRTNWLRALEALRAMPRMSRRCADGHVAEGATDSVHHGLLPFALNGAGWAYTSKCMGGGTALAAQGV